MSSAAAEVVALAAGVEEVERIGELLHLELELRVVEATSHELAELRALLRTQRVQERLRRGHLLAHLLQELVQVLRRIGAEHVAELVHEAVELGIVAGGAARQHLVQRPHHVLHALDVAVRHVLHHLFDVVEERLRHGLAELV